MHRLVLHPLEHLQQDLVNLLHGLNFLGCFTKRQSNVSTHNSYTTIITQQVFTTELSLNSSKHCSRPVSLSICLHANTSLILQGSLGMSVLAQSILGIPIVTSTPTLNTCVLTPFFFCTSLPYICVVMNFLSYCCVYS